MAVQPALHYVGFTDVGPNTVPALISRIRRGVPFRQMAEVADRVGLRHREMALALGVSVRSLHGKADDELLPAAAAERLLLLDRLIEHGLSVFDGRAELLAIWLRTPLAELAIREEPPSPTTSVPRQPTRQMGRFDVPFPLDELAESDRQRTAAVPVPQPQAPLDVLDTVMGYALADNVLTRIDAGVFS